MRRSWMMGLAAALAIVVLPGTGLAQVPPDRGRAFKIMKVGDWEQRTERVRSVFLKRLGEEIELDQTTLGKLARSFDRLQDQTHRLRGKREALEAKLRAAVERQAPEAELEAIRGELEGYRTRRHRLLANHQAKVRQILGPRRYAQYLLFRKKFHREVRQKLRERRHKQGQ